MTEHHPEIHYDGPKELAKLWHDFAVQFTANGPYNVGSANLLNQLAFGNGAEAIVREHCRPNDYHEAKGRIEECIQTLEGMGKDEAFRPLTSYTMGSLLLRWVELEKEHGLYPPASIRRYDHTKQADIDATLAKRKKLLQSPEGALIARAIESAMHKKIESKVEVESLHYGPRIDRSFIQNQAKILFTNCLFRFQPVLDTLTPDKISSESSRFFGYVEAALDRGLRTRIFDYLPQELMIDRNLFEGKQPPRPVEELALSSLPAPEDMASRSEQRELIKELLSTLTERQASVLTKRFGLDSDGDGKVLRVIAKEMGVGLERVRQIENEALTRLRYRSGMLPPAEDLELSDKPFRHIETATKKRDDQPPGRG